MGSWIRTWLSRPDWAVAIFALLAGTWRSGVPSYWTDEAATIMSARRPLWSLMNMARNVDAVHTAYYFVMRGWIAVSGGAPAAVRLSSALAVALGAAALTALARRMGWSVPWQAAAGVAFVLLPRMFYSAANARSAAIEALVAVLLMLCSLRAARARRPALWWALFAAVLLIGSAIFVFTVLLIPVCAVMLYADGHRVRGPYLRLGGWSLGVLVVLSPLLLLAQHQKGQIEFLAGRKVLDAHQIIDVQWFRSAPFSWIAWGLIVLAVLSPAIRAVWGTTRQGDRWIAPLLCWMLLPMLILGSVSLVYTPVFTQRYVTNSAGAVALLLVFGVHELRVPARWMRGLLRRERECRIWGTVATAGVRGVVVVCALLLLIPNLVQVREGTEMHRHADWNRVAAVVGQYSHRGDAVLYDSVVRQSWSPRNIAHVYPSDFSGLHDVGLRTPYWKTGGLWDVSVPLSEVPARVRPYERVWTIQVRASRGAAALQDVMTPLGYSAEKTWRFSLDTVTLWTRG
ncbi:MAG: hypothetical protein LKF88_04065 [Microbacteriaceae bacterium]|nr:hypothetical protein [Microbacteriaceae bacterium]